MSKLTPLNFIPTTEKLTQYRVEMVLKYVIYCYQKMILDGKTYLKSASLNEAGNRYNLEEHLSKVFVKDYLDINTNIKYYQNSIIKEPSVFLIFNCEPRQSYTEKGILKDEFIDIKVNETELIKIWNDAGIENSVHIAIECKILENGYSEYVSDIEKMCQHNFDTIRLPFECQIGYVLNPTYTSESIKTGINKNLKTNTIIDTVNDLKKVTIESTFPDSYISSHKRNYPPNSTFKDYHLFFDYTNIVI